jgi:O-antigen/teichoic acid export membrane protein
LTGFFSRLRLLGPWRNRAIGGDNASASLTKSALEGVAWNSTGSAVLIIAQIASTAATARLVAPREFGVYATAQAAAGLAGYFTMNAIGSGLLRRSQLGSKTIGTAIILSLASSTIVSLGLWLGASPWAHAWGVPEAAEIVRVVAITLFLTSAATVPVALIRRRLHFGTAAIIETVAAVIGLAGGVALAIELHSALALALGQAVGAAALLVGASVIARDELRLSFERAEARELFTFASQVSVLGFGAYVTLTAPSWFAARIFGPFTLGLYSRASMIVFLPLTYIATSITKVLYPLYGRVREDAVRTRILLDDALTLTTGFLWPAFALVAGASPVIVAVLLGARWHGAAPLVALFALIACGNLPCVLLTNAAEALGWMRLIAVQQIALFAGVAATLAIVRVAGLSLNWVLAGVAVSQWVAYAVTLTRFVRRELLDIRSLLRGHSIHAGMALAVYGIAVVCARAVRGAPVTIRVLLLTTVAVVVCSAFVAARSRFPAGRVLQQRLFFR